jgi:PAS domain S-box-containing protein
MKISSITKVFLVIFLVLSAANLTLAFIVSRAMVQDDLHEQRRIFQRYSTEIHESSDLLTEMAQFYVVTGDISFYNRFWGEIDSGRQENALETLEAAGALPEELALAHRASYLSGVLAQLEERAFVYMRAGNQARALELMFGPEYIAGKEPIIAYLDDFYYTMTGRIDQELADLMATSRMFAILIIISSVALAVAGTVGLISIMRKIMPIGGLITASREIAKGNMNVNLRTGGKDEIGELARSFALLQKETSALVDDILAVGNETMTGNLLAKADESRFEGAFADVVESVNSIAQNSALFVDNVNGVFVRLDTDFRARFLNRYTIVEQGFDKAILGMTIFDVLPPEIAHEFKKNFDQARDTGQSVTSKLELVLPTTGQTAVMEYVYQPVKDSRGETRAYLLIGTDITEMVKAEKVAAKVKAYQDYETKDIAEKLLAGLDQGILKFDFEVEPYDDDTADAAETFGAIAEVIKSALAHIKSYINEINEALAAIASGDLTVMIHRNYKGDFSPTKDAINNISSNLYQTMSRIFAAADQVLIGANQVTQTATDLASGAANQASSLIEIQSSVEVINEKTKHNASSAMEANVLSNKSTDSAREGNNAMEQMLEAMNGIKESSNDISQIVMVIQEIAFQTNLLALNASVEAARAGDHGRGFAVVAEEVRNLANRSQAAATETTSLIEDSINRVDLGSGIATATADALGAIVKNADEVLNIVTNIAKASNELTEAIGQMTSGIGQISNVVQSNSAISEEAAAAAEELNSQAELMRELIAFFKL